jgi:hypothetical protein
VSEPDKSKFVINVPMTNPLLPSLRVDYNVYVVFPLPPDSYGGTYFFKLEFISTGRFDFSEMKKVLFRQVTSIQSSFY